jgi:uncharacterized surface protein with fasciclin (FAS1) repeats
MKIKILLLLILIPATVVLASLVFNYSGANLHKKQPAQTTSSYVSPDQDVLVNLTFTPKFSQFVALIKEAQEDSTLQTHAGPFTIFAPTNQAIEKLPPKLLTSVLYPPNRSSLVELINTHIVLGNYPTSSFHDGMILTTIQGSKFKITKKDNNWYLNGAALIDQHDLVAKNGVIHQINKVLIPKN